MSKVVLGNDLGKKLVDALNLGDKVTGIDIRIRAGELVTMRVERCLGLEDGEFLLNTVSSYCLAEQEKVDPISTRVDEALRGIRSRYNAALDWLDRKHESNCLALAQGS